MPERVPYRRTFVRLLGFLRPYKASLAVSVVLAVISQGAQIAILALTAPVIDSAIRPRDRHALWMYMGLILLLGATKALAMVGRRLISGRQALGVEYDMRNRLYSHLLRLSFGFYDRHQTGQLMSRATVDLQTVRFFLGYGLIFFFQHVLTVLAVTGILFFFNWRLALIALAVTPLLIVLAYRYSHISHPVLRDVQQKLADVATVAEENIVGVHVVKAFAREDQEQAKFALRSERVFERSVLANRQRAFYVPLISFMPLLAQAAVLLVGGRMVAHGHALDRRVHRVQPAADDARDAAADARHVDRAGAARNRLRRADLRGDGRAGGTLPSAPGPSSSRPARVAFASRTSRSSTPPGGRRCTGSTSRSSRARRSR